MVGLQAVEYRSKRNSERNKLMDNSEYISRPSGRNKWLILIPIVLALLATIIVIVATLTITDRNRDPSMELVANHSETPVLKLYRSLSPEMTIAELSRAATAASHKMEVKLYQDGRGEVTMPEQTDIIRFYHNLGTEGAEDDSDELDDEVVDNDTTTEITDYPSTETIFDIEYLSFLGEAGYAIYYNADEGYYEVSDMGEVYQFDTKEDAIEAFLAPVVKEQ